jgi:putative membrane protein
MMKAFILLLFAVFIFILHETGEITRFINPNYLYFSQIASVLFLFLFFIQVPRIFTVSNHNHSLCGPWGCNHEADEGEGLSLKCVITYGMIALPLLTGFLIPYKDLGAAEALKRGVSYASHHDHSHLEEHDWSHRIEDELFEIINSPELHFTKDNFASYMTAVTSYPHRFIGKSIMIEGFILEDDFHFNKQTVITRFLITHCVADAHATGLIIEDGTTLEIGENTWIRLKGELNVRTDARLLIPIITVDSWEYIQPPLDPYIYP